MVNCFLKKVLFLFLVFLSINLPLWSSEIKVAVLYKEGIPVYEQIFLSFRKYMKENKGLTPSAVAFPKGESERARTTMLNLNFDYVFALGRTSAEMSRDLGIAGVYVLVRDPVKEGFANEDGSPSGKLVGIRSELSFAEQLNRIAIALPGKKKVGIVYNPGHSGITYRAFHEALLTVDTSFSLESRKVNNAKEVLSAFNDMKGKVDFFMGLPDRMVFNRSNLKNIFLCSIRNQIPLIGFAKSMSKSGALISFYNDYSALGEQAGNLLVRYMDKGDAQGLSLEEPKQMKYSVNKKIAKLMKLNLPIEVYRGAEEIYG